MIFKACQVEPFFKSKWFSVYRIHTFFGCEARQLLGCFLCIHRDSSPSFSMYVLSFTLGGGATFADVYCRVLRTCLLKTILKCTIFYSCCRDIISFFKKDCLLKQHLRLNGGNQKFVPATTNHCKITHLINFIMWVAAVIVLFITSL